MGALFFFIVQVRRFFCFCGSNEDFFGGYETVDCIIMKQQLVKHGKHCNCLQEDEVGQLRTV